MHMSEWPLTSFTILAQMAVGGFIVLGFVQVLARSKYDSKTIDRISDPALYALGPIMVLALMASIFHLGDPFHSPNALRNPFTSPLSREIWFGVGFAALGFAYSFVQWKRWFTPKVRQILAGITALWGIGFLWIMSSVYLLRTVPSWNHWTTPAQFFTTAALLGTLAIATAFSAHPYMRNSPIIRLAERIVPRGESEEADDIKASALIRECLNGFGFVTVLLLPLEIIIALFNYGRPAGVNPPVEEFTMAGLVVRLVLLVVGAGLMGMFLIKMTRAQEHNRERILTRSNAVLALVTASYILVIVSEVIGRFMFYGSMDRIGI